MSVIVNPNVVLGGREAADVQAQIAANAAAVALKLNTLDAPATVRGTALTGIVFTDATPVTELDNPVSAAGKLQRQINDSRIARVPAVAGRYYSNCNYGTTSSASTVAAGQRRTAFFEPLADTTIDQIGVFLTTAPTAGAKIKLAIYEFNPANPQLLTLVHTVPEIVCDATIGAKLVSTSFAFKLRRVYVITHLSDSSLAMRNFASSSGLAAGLETVSATAPISLWVETGVTYSATAPASLDLTSVGVLSSNPTLIVMRAA